MIKTLIIIFISLFFINPVCATETEIGSQTTPPEEVLTRKEKEQKSRAARIAKEREQPTSRFKQKAYQRATQRELRQQNIREDQLRNASRFQKDAINEEQARIAEEKGLSASNIDNKSRFTLKAEEKARKRALKEQEKLNRKRRRNN